MGPPTPDDNTSGNAVPSDTPRLKKQVFLWENKATCRIAIAISYERLQYHKQWKDPLKSIFGTCHMLLKQNPPPPNQWCWQQLRTMGRQSLTEPVRPFSAILLCSPCRFHNSLPSNPTTPVTFHIPRGTPQSQASLFFLPALSVLLGLVVPFSPWLDKELSPVEYIPHISRQPITVSFAVPRGGRALSSCGSISIPIKVSGVLFLLPQPHSCSSNHRQPGRGRELCGRQQK